MSGIGIRRAAGMLFAIAMLAVIALLPVVVPTVDTTDSPAPSPTTNAAENAARPTDGIFAGVTATQQFPAAGTSIHSIALLLATNQRVNHGTAHVTVQANTHDKWQNLAIETIEEETLQDNAFYTLSFSPPLRVMNGQPLRIVLQADGGAGDAIAWWTDTNWKPDGYMLTFNGTEQDGTARFMVSYSPESGHLFQLLVPIWHRMTVFLDPIWQIALLFGFGSLLGSLFLLGRHLFA